VGTNPSLFFVLFVLFVLFVAIVVKTLLLLVVRVVNAARTSPSYECPDKVFLSALNPVL